MAILSNGAILGGYRELTEDLGVDSETAMRGIEIVANFIEPLRCDACKEGDFCKGCKTEKYQKKIPDFYDHSKQEDEILETIAKIGDGIKETNKMAKELAEDCVNLKQKISRMDGFDDFEINPGSEFFKSIDSINRRLNQAKNFDTTSALGHRLDDIENRFRHPAEPEKFDVSKLERKPIPEKRKFVTTPAERNSEFYC